MKYSSMEDELRELKEKQGFRTEDYVKHDLEPKSLKEYAARTEIFDSKIEPKERNGDPVYLDKGVIKGSVAGIVVPVIVLAVIRVILSGIAEGIGSDGFTIFAEVVSGVLRFITAVILISGFVKLIRAQKTFQAGIGGKKVMATITKVESTLDANKRVTMTYNYNGQRRTIQKMVPVNSSAKKGDSFELYINPDNPNSASSGTEFNQGKAITIAILIIAFIIIFSILMSI